MACFRDAPQKHANNHHSFTLHAPRMPSDALHGVVPRHSPHPSQSPPDSGEEGPAITDTTVAASRHPCRCRVRLVRVALAPGAVSEMVPMP